MIEAALRRGLFVYENQPFTVVILSDRGLPCVLSSTGNGSKGSRCFAFGPRFGAAFYFTAEYVEEPQDVNLTLTIVLLSEGGAPVQ